MIQNLHRPGSAGDSGLSGDFIEHSSFRVTRNAVRLGEAAGRDGAVAARTGRPPQPLSTQDLKLS